MKVKLQVTIEVDHIDSLPALISELHGLLDSENLSGSIEKEDGDKTTWKVEVAQ